MCKLFPVNCQTMNEVMKEPHYCAFNALRWNCIDYNPIWYWYCRNNIIFDQKRNNESSYGQYSQEFKPNKLNGFSQGISNLFCLSEIDSNTMK